MGTRRTVSSNAVGRGGKFLSNYRAGQGPDNVSVATDVLNQLWVIGVVRRQRERGRESGRVVAGSRYDVQTAQTESTAVEVALANHPNAALLAIELPELDGYQVAVRNQRKTGHEMTVLSAMTG